MTQISFLPGDLAVLEIDALIAAASAIDIATLTPGAAGALAREDWRQRAEGAVGDPGRLVAEILRRASGEGRWPAETRDRAIELVERLRAALPEAGAFFARVEHREGLRKLKARALMQQRADRIRAAREARAIQRVELSAHADDVSELRRYAADLLRKRGIEPIAPRPRGRPPKNPPPTEHDPLGPFFAKPPSPPKAM